MNRLIELRGISKIYRTKGGCVRALDNVSLTVEKGEFLSVIGQSGSGKSTLMNILGCLDQPTEGSYYLEDMPVSEMNERMLSFVRNSTIGFIFQSFHLIPTMNALENVELPLIYRGMSRRKRTGLAADAIRLVGLGERMFHRPNELSGGQQQRVAIARAIAAEPELILADEPTGNLDSKSGADVMGILKELNRQGTSVVMITHDREIADMAQRCIRISDGKIVG